MRALTEIGVALSFALIACGGSGSSGGGGNGGTATGGAGGAGTGAHHGHGGHNQTGGGSANGGASANGGSSANGGAGTTSGVGGGGACDAAGICADDNGMVGCGHCALDDQSTPPGPCASLIGACTADSDCVNYAVCCMGKFPCDPSCKTQFPTGAMKFKPIDQCVCSKCAQSCQSDCQ